MGKNIIMVGFMGCGKTTVGRIVAKKLGYEFFDTDKYIEQKEGMSITEIFDLKGEPYFRSLELKVAEEISHSECHNNRPAAKQSNHNTHTLLYGDNFTCPVKVRHF